MSSSPAAGPLAAHLGFHAQAIEIHIDELLLEGLSALEGHAAGDALERELGRLLRAHGPSLLSGLWPAMTASESGEVRISLEDAPAGSFTLEPSTAPGAIGRQAAHIVFGSLRASLGGWPAGSGTADRPAGGSAAFGRKDGA